MPDDPDTITWPWIKEALASDEISKVKLLSFVTSLTLGSYVQEVYQLFNTLSTPMQERCNLMSLPDVFHDIPEVDQRSCLCLAINIFFLILLRFTKSCRINCSS